MDGWIGKNSSSFVNMIVLCHSYLEVTMHDAVLVQIADGLQHLLDHSAGILLRVNPPVQNTVKELTA